MTNVSIKIIHRKIGLHNVKKGIIMSKIKLLSQNIFQHTLINNLFIDYFMPSANGDYVKVYLYLLRLACSGQTNFSSTQIAKQLHLIESDVIRSLKYWNEMNILEIHFEEDTITSIGLLSLDKVNDTIVEPKQKPLKTIKKKTPVKIYERPEYSMDEILLVTKQDEFKQLLYITEKFLSKRLTQTDINVLFGFIDWLGLSIDVVEFLIEYCVSNGHRHMNYIEKVAIDWADQNITTVAEAKVIVDSFNKNYYRIMRSLGTANRQPTKAQIKIMDRWINDYNFALEVIEKACEKTIETINKPELKYVDTILTRWHNKGIKSLKAIEELDVAFKSTKAQKSKTTAPKTNNRFHNHDQRTYDYELLEKRMNEAVDNESN